LTSESVETPEAEVVVVDKTPPLPEVLTEVRPPLVAGPPEETCMECYWRYNKKNVKLVENV
jgi:hypothetical protein